MRLRRTVSILALCLALLAAAAACAAPAPRGVLSGAEYQQLRGARRRIRSLASADTRSLGKAKTVCTRMRDVSPLIAAVRSGCLDLIKLAGDNGKLDARATKCGIDPSSEAAIFTCLIPAVQSFYEDAEGFYRAEARVDAIARARGFSSTCVAVIGGSPGNLAAEKRLAGDLKATVAALRRQNPSALQTLSSSIQRDARAIRAGPNSLSLCPHR